MNSYTLILQPEGNSRQCDGPIPSVGDTLLSLDRAWTVQAVRHEIVGWERRGMLHTASVRVIATSDEPTP